jgi:hypothetical protein
MIYDFAGTILLERKCPFTGALNSMELPLTHREYDRGITKWEDGALIQVAFPTLTADQREFIKTGITPETWTNIFGEDTDA